MLTSPIAVTTLKVQYFNTLMVVRIVVEWPIGVSTLVDTSLYEEYIGSICFEETNAAGIEPVALEATSPNKGESKYCISHQAMYQSGKLSAGSSTPRKLGLLMYLPSAANLSTSGTWSRALMFLPNIERKRIKGVAANTTRERPARRESESV